MHIALLVTATVLLGAVSVHCRGPNCSKINGCSRCELRRGISGRTETHCTDCLTGWSLRDPKTCDCSPGWAFNRNSICTLCIEGQYCPGGNARSNPSNAAFECPPGTATIIQGAISQGQCVTKPGYGRISTPGPDGKVSISAVLCAVGTYNGGLNTLPCQKCGVGLTTAGQGSTSAVQCMAPPGFYMDKITNTAKKCQKGTYSSKLNADQACTPCPADATTARDGSSSAAACIPAN